MAAAGRRARRDQRLRRPQHLRKRRQHRIQQRRQAPQRADVADDRAKGPFLPRQDHLVARQFRRRCLQLGSSIRTSRLRSRGAAAQERTEKAPACSAASKSLSAKAECERRLHRATGGANSLGTESYLSPLHPLLHAGCRIAQRRLPIVRNSALRKSYSNYNLRCAGFRYPLSAASLPIEILPRGSYPLWGIRAHSASSARHKLYAAHRSERPRNSN